MNELQGYPVCPHISQNLIERLMQFSIGFCGKCCWENFKFGSHWWNI